VSALAVWQGDLIAGGAFPRAGAAAASFIARWDGVEWSPLGPGPNGPVDVLAVYDGDLVAGGIFTYIGEIFVGGIARWDGAQWTPLGVGVGGC